MDALDAIVVLVVTLLASVAQGFAAFGFALIAVPFFLLLFRVEDAVALATLLGMINVAFTSYWLRASVRWGPVGRIVAGGFAGMPLGILALLFASQDALRIAVGLSAVLMAGGLAAGLRVRASGPLADLLVGSLSGVLRTSTAMAGPPVVVYLQGQGYETDAFRASVASVLFLGGIASLVALAAAGLISIEMLLLAAVGLPAVAVGTALGHRLLTRIDTELFRRLVLLLLVATSLSAVGLSIVRLL